MKRLSWSVGCLPLVVVLAGCNGTEGPGAAGRSASTETDAVEEGEGSERSLVIAVDDASFERRVIMSETPVLVDFSASWCAPCRKMEPRLQAIAQEYDGRVVVAKVDIDANKSLQRRYKVSAIPAMVLFHNGQPIHQVNGVVSRSDLSKTLTRELLAIATPPKRIESRSVPTTSVVVDVPPPPATAPEILNPPAAPVDREASSGPGGPLLSPLPAQTASTEEGAVSPSVPVSVIAPPLATANPAEVTAGTGATTPGVPK